MFSLADTCYDVSMSELSVDINNLKKKYREIFLKSSDEIHHQIDKLKPKEVCHLCDAHGCNLKIDVFDSFPDNCAYRDWQNEVIKLLNEDIPKGIYEKWMKILDYRKEFHCTGCATCCRLACSEFSYEELKTKALNGDNFAQQFTSIFIPYKTETEAKAVYPEYFELLAEKLDGENVYFYHCPKLSSDNRCSDYENRPQICRDFPDNPLSLLPRACGHSKWKEEVEPTALMLHSMLEIIDFYKSKIPKY